MKHREIKFRAWILEEKNMLVNGDWFTLDPCSPHPIIQYADQGWYCNNANASGEHLENLNLNDIEPKDEFILMEYTGLKDRKGNEIYESDFVLNRGTKCLVVWNISSAGWVLADMDTKGAFMPFDSRVAEHDCDVVGNIYEPHD